jgi:hypothetical protein
MARTGVTIVSETEIVTVIGTMTGTGTLPETGIEIATDREIGSETGIGIGIELEFGFTTGLETRTASDLAGTVLPLRSRVTPLDAVREG